MLSKKEYIFVNDTCVLFDLIDLNLLNSFFQLGYSVCTTKMVIGEIIDESQISIITKCIADEKLIIDDLVSFETLQSLYDELPGLSYTDCSIIELATRKEGIVLSSDKGLRNESKRRNLTVRGILWIIETLVNEKIITADIAVEKLKVYPNINQRAPINEITLLINKLENNFK